ncbi:MAG: HmuY family protein [Psychroflexus halocasei]|uniref:HmuY family protein n=1 Tax=Psychroflexus sp. S27 TaxID=1982757 RepID=UPI000C2998FB|nr:HmuY family protein [Psychroflexus sp. S27]PJX27595.1 hypothetical protein CAP47_01815 [Psychroflexus sp. S27]
MISLDFNFFKILVISFFITSCSDDKTLTQDPFVVAFEELSINHLEAGNEFDIPLIFSDIAEVEGQVLIDLQTINAVYGQDFVTQPPAENGQISVLIEAGQTSQKIRFQKLNQNLDETSEIDFKITQINYFNSQIQGNTQYQVNASPTLGGSLSPEIGGPAEEFQVYVDLSSKSQKKVQRDHWDLGFYGGNHDRVVINSSIYMAAKSLESNDIDAVTEQSVSHLKSKVTVGTFDPANAVYVDHPDGSLEKTAISEIKLEANENKVYLLNLGYEVGNDTANSGSVNIAGSPRGWKKIRILKSNDTYILQYADLNAQTHQEVTIPKKAAYNFNFFSFDTENFVSVEPEKDRWDINFTVFTNLIEDAGSYGYSDFVLHNRKAGAKAYKADEISSLTYNEFSLNDIDQNAFKVDQRAIGESWRDVFSGQVFQSPFYVVQDPNGNYYKLRFLSLTNQDGDRGYPKFEFKLLE